MMEMLWMPVAAVQKALCSKKEPSCGIIKTVSDPQVLTIEEGNRRRFASGTRSPQSGPRVGAFMPARWLTRLCCGVVVL